MFPALEDKPDAQKIIGDNPAAGRKDVAQRKMHAIKVVFPTEHIWKHDAENFEEPYFYQGAYPAGEYEGENLSLALQYFFH